MVLGLVLASLMASVCPGAFFNRRSRANWLDELAEIRQEALVLPEGGVDHAMNDDDEKAADSVPETEPGTEPSALGAPAAEPDAAPESESELASQSTGPKPKPRFLTEALDPESDQEPELAPGPEFGPPESESGSHEAPADSLRLGADVLDSPPGDPLGRPTPHRERPHELWHPGFDVGPPTTAPAPTVAEEVVDRRDLVDDVGVGQADDASMFRRFPSMEPAPSAAETNATHSDAGEVDVVQGRDVIDEDVVDVAPAAGGTQLSATAFARAKDTLPPPVDLFSLPEADARPTEPDQASSGASEPDADGPVATGLTSAVIARRPSRSLRPRRTLFGVQPAERGRPAILTTSGSFPEHLTAAADGTIDLVPGVIRIPAGDTVEITAAAGEIGITVDDGWCWFALPGTAIRTIRAVVPSGTLLVPPGTTALVIIEPEGSTFVAVLAGAASLEQAHGNLALGAGSVALAPPGGKAQVDKATPSELAREPIVTHNIRLDSDR